MRERTASATWSRSAGLSRRRMRRADPWLITAALALLALVFLALFGERIAPHESIYFVVEHGADPRPYDPGLVFPFGSDVLGRDLFSLVLAGARATLTIVLLAGFARVAAGVLVLALGSWWRPARLLTETIAELVAAVPATLVALVLIKAFVKTDTSVLVFIGALLLVGWAGPYRVIRAELDRLMAAPFTEGARAMGASRSRLFWRHHLPHLVPVIAINLSQQVVASLVLVAELGVLGVLVGTVRSINVEESLSVVRTGPPMTALIPDTPEWGALLATSRTVEALWLTRWLIFVPGAAFALTAIAVAAIGLALARRYARRDILQDGRGAGFAVLILAGLFVGASLIPERYAAAHEWANVARTGLAPVPNTAAALADAGLRTYSALQQVAQISRAGSATVTIGAASVSEPDPRPLDPAPNSVHVQSVVAGGTGGVVEGPLVFAARGIVPSDYAPAAVYKPQPRAGPDLGPLVRDYPDDYAGIDVRGKVVLLVRFMGIDARDAGYAYGPAVETSIGNAIARGARGVLFVDPDLAGYRKTSNPYLQLEQDSLPTRTSGVPVMVLDPTTARTLVAPLGLDLSPFLGYDQRGTKWEGSAARDLGISARVAVPLREDTVTVQSLIGEVPDVPATTGRVVIWAPRNLETTALDPARAEVLASVARLASARHAPFVFVDFDTHADTQAVRDVLKDRRVVLVLVLEEFKGGVLHFTTANGDLIPAIDLYAQKAGAQYEVTRQTAVLQLVGAPFPGVKTVAISADGPGDARADAAALIGYLAGRLALGAPELPR